MAGDDCHDHRGLDGWLEERLQAQLGILALPAEQRALDCLGLSRWGLCAHPPPNLSRFYKHSRRQKERILTISLRWTFVIDHFGSRLRVSGMKTANWIKRLGVWGLLFFLVKGLLWLIVPALAVYLAN